MPAIQTYQFMRQQGMNPIDACTDAAQLHGIAPQALAASLIAAGIDAARLSLI
jgi:hypothetical protein